MKSIESMCKVIFITVGTVILITFFFCLFRINAVANTGYFNRETESFETQYKKELSEILKDSGAKNSGINLEKKCEDGHHFDYKVTVNLPKYITNDEKDDIYVKLSAVNLKVPDSSVSIIFFGKEE